MSTATKHSRANPVQHTDYTDNLIRAAYTSENFGRKPIIQRLVNTTGFSVGTIHRRATALGVASTRRQYAWSAAELEIVEENAHKTLDAINAILRRAGYRSRTSESIRCQIFKIGLSKRQARYDAGMYSASEASRMIGCTPTRVAQMIGSGHLKAKLRDDCKQKEYLISAKDIRTFLLEYPAEVNLYRADKYWLIHCLAGKL